MEVYMQLFSFLITVGIGAILGVMFDFYRTTRRFFRIKKAMTMIFDGLYWLAAIIVAFVCLLYSNWAEMRFYVFFGILGGAGFYYRFLSQYILIFLFKLFQTCFTVQSRVKSCIVQYLMRPLGYVLGIFLFPFRYGTKKLRKIGGSVKKKMSVHEDVTKK